jgi:diguanylate cyclase (GGDEF)-like protein
MSTRADTRRSIPYQSFKYLKPALLYRKMSDVLKRAFDIIVALLGLILLSPFFMIIARLVKRDTPGPVFYSGPRVGKDGRIFRMVKFRTMFESPDSYSGPRLTAQGDTRITPLGMWLRDTKINELPQLWNVLIGDMSLVGPRPEDPEIAKSWPEDAGSKITSIRPGITSPASILYRDEEKLLSQKGALDEYYKSILPEKIRLDLLYVHHHSFFSDLDTIFWTLFILVPSWAKLKIPETHFFAGPIARISHRYVSWFFIDLLTSLAVIGFSAIIWRTQFPLNWGVKYIFLLGVILAVLFSGVNSITGLNRIVWTHSTSADAIGLILSSGFVTVLILGLNYLDLKLEWLGLPSLPKLMIIAIGGLSGISFIITRYRLLLLKVVADWWLSLRRNNMVLGERVLVIGDGEAGQIATWLLSRPMYRTAFTVVGVINDNDPSRDGMKFYGHRMLGTLKDIPKVIRRYDVGVILSTTPIESKEVNEHIFELCRKNNLRLIFLNDLTRMVEQQETQPVGSYEYPLWLDEHLAFKAMYDAVTGLPNRYLFQDRMKHALSYSKRYKSRLAMLVIRIEREDIDSGVLGHIFDDKVLIEVAKRLTSGGIESDTLAYVGKNKFAVLLENIPDEGYASSIAQEIVGLLSEPIKIEQFEVPLHTFIDIRVSCESDGNDEMEAFCNLEIAKQSETKHNTEVIARNDIALGK